MQITLHFNPNDVKSRHGFCDGDLIYSTITGYSHDKYKACMLLLKDVNERRFLFWIFKRFVLPKIFTPIQIHYIITSHNPIRLLPNDNAWERRLFPRSITITEDFEKLVKQFKQVEKDNR